MEGATLAISNSKGGFFLKSSNALWHYDSDCCSQADDTKNERNSRYPGWNPEVAPLQKKPGRPIVVVSVGWVPKLTKFFPNEAKVPDADGCKFQSKGNSKFWRFVFFKTLELK